MIQSPQAASRSDQPNNSDDAARSVADRATDKRFVAFSAIAATAAIVGGFWMLGSPLSQRAIALDRERIQDLRAIARIIRNDSLVTNEDTPRPLPEAIPAAVTANGDYVDPQTQEPYEYTRIDEDTYELCATFATQSKAGAGYDLGWAHPAGKHCFELESTRFEPVLDDQ